MWRTPPDFGTWITDNSQRGRAHDRDGDPERSARRNRARGDSRTPCMEHRQVGGSAGSTADALTPDEPRAPLGRAEVDRIWQRVSLVGKREG
jgi:hypothetical protein